MLFSTEYSATRRTREGYVFLEDGSIKVGSVLVESLVSRSRVLALYILACRLADSVLGLCSLPRPTTRRKGGQRRLLFN